MNQSEGIEDEDIDALKIHDKGKDISEAVFLNNTLGKLSTPPLPLLLSFFKILKTLPGLKKTDPTLGRKSASSIENGGSLLSSWTNTVAKWSFNNCALSVSLLCRLPPKSLRGATPDL